MAHPSLLFLTRLVEERIRDFRSLVDYELLHVRKATPLSAEEKDRLRGAFYGCLIGDALGLPHERGKVPYTGVILPHTHRSRFQGNRQFAHGQFSDDGELMIALLGALVRGNGKYTREKAIKAYLEWANSGNPCMGRNTRELFHGVKTVAGYEKRFRKNFPTPEASEKAQSNGALMRCFGLVLVWLCDETVGEEALKTDVYLSNPSTTCLVRELIYVRVCLQLVRGETPDLPPFRELIVTGADKGWVVYAQELAFQSLRFDSFQAGIDWVIQQGGDTDTNAAIAGVLLGAKFGYQAMLREEKTRENLHIVKEVDMSTSQVPRPREYSAKQGSEWLEQLMEL
jgi:ADP-ribosyl-[dinitrogen reductase] hydrolase